jgi:hypothetical protein
MKAAKRKKAPARKTTRAAKAPPAPSPEEMFEALMESRDLTTAVKYNVKTELESGELLKHASFGYGIVVSVADAQKAKVLFKDGERIMACNRK